MKKIIPLALILMLPLFAFAQSSDLPYGEAPVAKGTIWELLKTVLNWFFNVVVILAAIFLVYAGFTFLTAGGNPEKTSHSFNILMYSLVGLGIAILAKFLVNVIFGMLVPGKTPFTQ